MSAEEERLSVNWLEERMITSLFGILLVVKIVDGVSDNDLVLVHVNFSEGDPIGVFVGVEYMFNRRVTINVSVRVLGDKFILGVVLGDILGVVLGDILGVVLGGILGGERMRDIESVLVADGDVPLLAVGDVVVTESVQESVVDGGGATDRDDECVD